MNVVALKKAFTTLVDRHESLRTRFINVGGTTRQQVLEPVDFQVEELDLSEKPHPETLAQGIMDKEASTHFELSKGTLLRVILLKLAEDRHFLILTMHHIISDGWSLEVLFQEIFTLYKAYSANQENPLPPLQIQYKDYAAWQNQLLAGVSATKLKQYWHDKLKSPLPVLNLATDYERPTLKTYDSNTVIFNLEKTVTDGLSQVGKAHNASLFMVFVALVRVLLYRHTAQPDIIIGTALAGRNHPDLQEQIGFYVNLLPLRSQISAVTILFNPSYSKIRESFLMLMNTSHILLTYW